MSRKSSRVKKRSSLKFADIYELPNQGLVTYFDKSDRGNDRIYHSPWIKVDDAQFKTVAQQNEEILRQLKSMLDDWMPHLNQLSETWPGLLQFEKDLAAKVGPMSIQKPVMERLDDVDDYYTCIKTPAVAVPDEAVEAALNKFHRIKGLRLRSQANTLDRMKTSTNSGAPYFNSKRSNVIKKSLPVTIQGDLQIIGPERKAYYMCATLGWRGQEGGPNIEDVKQRVLFMFPFSVNLAELRVYQPMIEQCQKYNLVPAWVSMESVDEAITKLFDSKGKDDLVVCTDFSKFDHHFGPMMQQCAEKILRGILREDEQSSEWLEQVFPIKYHIPLAISMNYVVEGQHGMGSGSGGTNADETLAHTALQYAAAQSIGAELNPNSMCLGDDGILSFPGINEDIVVNEYTKYGLEMNPSKQSSSTHECTYLRRWHDKDYRINGICVGVYSTARALGRLCMQERYYDPKVWGPKMVALRQLSILENCKYHPLREEFVEWCLKRDRYRLGLDIPGFFENLEEEAQKAIEFKEDFLGYVRSQMRDDGDSGINEWWIVQYLKSKR